MVSTPCTSSILHCLISFRWVKLADSKAQNVNLKIQIHFLFLIRVAGDIFSSMENIEEKVQDFQDYLNTICTRYASELDLVILEFRHRKLPLPLYKRMNYNFFWRFWGFGSINFFLSFSILYCLMFARFIYVRYASGFIENGVKIFNILVLVIIFSLYGYILSLSLLLIKHCTIFFVFEHCF